MVAGKTICRAVRIRIDMSDRLGGDDAFAIKALKTATYNITIATASVAAIGIASFGSEIGTASRPSITAPLSQTLPSAMSMPIAAARCCLQAGALIYDWRNGLTTASGSNACDYR